MSALKAFHPAGLLIALMSVQWAPIAKTAGFSVQVAYLGIILLIMLTLASAGMRRGFVAVLRRNASWLVPYAVYLLLLTLALYGSPGQNMAPRQIFYLTGALCLSAFIVQSRDPGRTLRTGAGIGISLFILVIEIIARDVGLSWYVALQHFLTTGDFDFIVYGFFRAVFNAYSDGEDLAVAAALKNGVAVSIFVMSLIFRIGYGRRGADWIGVGLTLLALFLILMLNTRSVLIVAGVSMLLAGLLRSATRHDESTAALVMKMALAIMLVLGTVLIFLTDNPVVGMISDRFAFEDASTENRVAQYGWALQMIEHNLLLGNGYTEHDGRLIHNLFLSAWVQAGLVAFFLVASFYLAVAGIWVAFVFKVTCNPQRWVLPLPFEWVAMLPILPLFRVWLSGDAGHLFLGEWVALATFFGCILRNDLAMREIAGMRGHANRVPVSFRAPRRAGQLMPSTSPAIGRLEHDAHG
ncbi:O-antigen ligase family protein [Mesorhizobium sp. M1406]|uniref:O-antigen ligase family protein n=1 Tax=Mesorhizobium sp. M1406 TaxID=2957099 RepID=UPI0033380D01